MSARNPCSSLFYPSMHQLIGTSNCANASPMQFAPTFRSDIPGGMNLEADDAAGCAALCSDHALCTHFTFIWGGCYLKVSGAGAAANAAGTSGICLGEKKGATHGCSLELSIDYYGCVFRQNHVPLPYVARKVLRVSPLIRSGGGRNTLALCVHFTCARARAHAQIHTLQTSAMLL